MPDGSGGIFLNLSVGRGGPAGGVGGRISMNIAVSFAEFALLRALAQYLSPRLLGFAEVRLDVVVVPSSLGPNVTSSLLTLFHEINDIVAQNRCNDRDVSKEDDGGGGY